MTESKEPNESKNVGAKSRPTEKTVVARDDASSAKSPPQPRPKEIGGPAGPEPTRYGDWERKGIVSDF